MKNFAKSTVSVLALTCLLSAAQVSAAELEPISAYDWSGAYAGVKLGYAGSESRITDPNVGVSSGPYTIDGATGGVMSGYSLQWDSVVIGIDSDISITDINASMTNAVCAGASSPCRTEIEFFSTTRLRAGYSMERFLVYGTAGLATGLVDASVGSAEGKSEFHYGYAAGGGVEWAMADGLHARIEYLYADLQKKSHNFSGLASRVSINDMHFVRAGISVKTGWILDSIFAD